MSKSHAAPQTTGTERSDGTKEILNRDNEDRMLEQPRSGGFSVMGVVGCKESCVRCRARDRFGSGTDNAVRGEGERNNGALAPAQHCPKAG